MVMKGKNIFMQRSTDWGVHQVQGLDSLLLGAQDPTRIYLQGLCTLLISVALEKSLQLSVSQSSLV